MPPNNSKKMWLLMAVVQESLVQDFLTVLLELEVKGATIINTQGMGRTLAREFPIFAGLMNDLGAAKPFNKTVFALVDDYRIIDRIHRYLKEIDLDFTQPDTGIMFTIPVGSAVGTGLRFIDEDFAD